MTMFVRRFSSDPGNVVLLAIESIDVIDLTPPGAILGVGSGTVLCVGEFEDGPFATPQQVLDATDYQNTWGSLGYQYGSLPGQNPSARQRFADGALAPENWNGNGTVQLNASQFSELLLCRVDTSVGSVQVSRLAFLTGAALFRYPLQTGQVLQLDAGAGPLSATFTGTAASVTAVGGTYPTTFAGGNTLTLAYDQGATFTVTFQSTDQSIAQVIARINQFAGFAFATNTAGQLTFTGLQGGTGGQVQVVGGSAGVTTQLGLTAGVTSGAGNVANIANASAAEIALVVQAAIANTKVEQDQNNALRISNTAGPFLVVGAGTTATALGLLPGTEATATGLPILVSGAGTYTLGTAGTITIQLDNSLPSVTTSVAIADSLANVVTKLNAAFTAAGQGAPVTSDGATRFYVLGTKPGGTVSVVGASASAVLTELGLVVGQTKGAVPPLGALPAGTVVQSPGGAPFVTMQSVVFGSGGVTIAGVQQPNGATSWSVKVRPALDDGTGLGVGATAITQIATPPAIGAFSVINAAAISNALTESQIDAQYAIAIAATANVNTVAKTTNIIFAARQSNTIRNALRANAIAASSSGCYGRVAVIRTPLNTSPQTALSTTAAPGVGAYRSDRVIYCYPQANTFVPIIALVGPAGGAGYNASGNVDVGADGFLASVMSQLAPEENPAQQTSFMSGVNSIETGAAAQGFDITTYTAFKAAGICALIMDNGTASFQSGVTSVDPLVNPSRVNIKRRRMADFLQDSMAISLKEFGKKLGTSKRKNAIRSEIFNFLNGLAGGGTSAAAGNPNNEDAQRIAAYGIDVKTGNGPTVPTNLYRIIVAVQLLDSLDSIVLQTTIGESVIVSEILPQAA
jgi:hypothetical protein